MNELENQIKNLITVLKPFANYACSPLNDCHNCAAAKEIVKAEELLKRKFIIKKIHDRSWDK